MRQSVAAGKLMLMHDDCARVTARLAAPLRQRSGAGAVLGVALFLACVAVPSNAKPTELKLRLGMASTPAPPLPNSVNWLAKDLGFYQREGLDVELIEFNGTRSQ
jgi:ABC-type nitrate/sulfonate/bicarbonate transport system substrate-binding protein